MKDYSDLKGKEVKIINHPQKLKFKDCYVTEIDDAGLTIVGHCKNYSDPNKLLEIFCLDNSIDSHIKHFSRSVEMINNGVINLAAVGNKPNPFTGQLSCIFK